MQCVPKAPTPKAAPQSHPPPRHARPLLRPGSTVSVDDCWASSRDANNEIQADPVTFPSGMKALADYAHARGLKFGLYSSNSPKTCAQRPGSFGFEYQDAATYASWGVDLLKFGELSPPPSPPQYNFHQPPPHAHTHTHSPHSSTHQTTAARRTLLGRPSAGTR